MRHLVINALALLSIASGGLGAVFLRSGFKEPFFEFLLYMMLRSGAAALMLAGCGLLLRRHWGRWLWVLGASAFYGGTLMLLSGWAYADPFGVALLEMLGPPWLLCKRRWPKSLWIGVIAAYLSFIAYFVVVALLSTGGYGTGKALAFSMAMVTLIHMIIVTGIRFLTTSETASTFH